jgi:hypothetical protein
MILPFAPVFPASEIEFPIFALLGTNRPHMQFDDIIKDLARQLGNVDIVAAAKAVAEKELINNRFSLPASF